MSHKASHWLAELPPKAIKQGAFRVLFHLCDAHNSKRPPATACFPSQETLREATGLSNGGLNKCLNDLEEAGLIKRVRSTKPGTRERRTYYILGCDMEEQTPQSGDRTNSTFSRTNSTFSQNKLHSSGEEPVRNLKEPCASGAKSNFSDHEAMRQGAILAWLRGQRAGVPQDWLTKQRVAEMQAKGSIKEDVAAKLYGGCAS